MSRPKEQAETAFRVAISIVVGLVVTAVSLFVAWQNAREAQAGKIGQWSTQQSLKKIEAAISNFQQRSNQLPRSLNQALEIRTQERPVYASELKDGWNRPFRYDVTGTNYMVISYGRDGQPGGVGLDCDLTTMNRNPSAALPTFRQFMFDMPTERMITVCYAGGVLAALLSFFRIRATRFSPQGLAAAFWRTVAITIGAAIVASMIALLHIPSGH